MYIHTPPHKYYPFKMQYDEAYVAFFLTGIMTLSE